MSDDVCLEKENVVANDTQSATTWSECNYRIWKNPVISMVLAQQARGLYPKILKSKDTPLKNGFERCLTWIFGE